MASLPLAGLFYNHDGPRRISLLKSVPLDHKVCKRAGELFAEARRAGKTVPLGDGLHVAVAALEDLTVATIDVDHFKALGVRTVNPLK